MTNKTALDKINKQSKFWSIYSIVAPLSVVIVIVLLYMLDRFSLDYIFWISIGLFGVTSIIWWAWAVTTIYHLTLTLKKADETFVEILHEIQEIKSNVQKKIN
jgi:chromate transport protein ChrA